MQPKYLEEYKIKIRDDFFDKFVTKDENNCYFIWRGTTIKTNDLAGNVLSFIWKALDEYPKRRKSDILKK